MVTQDPITYSSPAEYLAQMKPLISAKKAELEKHEYQQYVKKLDVNATEIVQGEVKKGTNEAGDQEEENKEAPKKKKNKKKKKKQTDVPNEEMKQEEESSGTMAAPAM